MHAAPKALIITGIVVGAVGTVFVARGLTVRGALLTGLGAGFAAGVAALWTLGARWYWRHLPVEVEPTPTRGGMATAPPGGMA
jgi:hypothetical protein